MKGIKNVTIETVTNGFLKDSVVVFDKEIQFIGLLEEVPSTILVEEWIDGKGAFLFPGFIDVHTHLGIDEEGIGKEGDDFNETSHPLTPHLRVIDGINSFDPGYHEALKAGVTTVQVLPGSANVIGGLTAVLKVKPDRSVEEQCIKFPAGLKIALGENPKQFHRKNGIVTRMGIAGMLRETFWKTKNSLHKPPSTLAEETLQNVFKHNLPILAHAHRADDILTAIRIAEEFDLPLSIEHTTDGMRVLDKLKNSKHRVVLGPTMTGKSKLELANQSWDVYRAFHEAGIKFTITTDHPVVPIEEFITVVRKVVTSGLSEQAALEAITIHAAEHLGLSDALGSIEVGKDADLVLWSNHPLKDFCSYVTAVFVDGERCK